MQTARDVRRFFAYNDWANREEISVLRSIDRTNAGLRILAHLVAAEWLWLARLRTEKARLEVWPALTLDECDVEMSLLASTWAEYLTSADPNGTIHYTNSKGELFTSRVEDVLMHVILHGSYHRGQIALLARDAGRTPAYTDYIHCIRSEFVGT